MKVVLFRAAVSFLAFIIGVAFTGLGLFKSKRVVEVRTELLAYGSHCPHRTRIAEFSQSKSSCFPGDSVEISRLPSNVRYLPKSLRPLVDQFDNGPALIPASDADETYRLMILPNFRHPSAVRMWRKGDEMFLTRKELGFLSKEGPGRVISTTNRQLSPEEWSKFTSLLDDSCFWNLPVDDAANDADGADWILEGVKDGRYHVTHTTSPQSGAFFAACEYLKHLSRDE